MVFKYGVTLGKIFNYNMNKDSSQFFPLHIIFPIIGRDIGMRDNDIFQFYSPHIGYLHKLIIYSYMRL